MLKSGQIDSTRLTESSFGFALARDCTKQCDPKEREVTQVVLDSENDIGNLDNGILSLSVSLDGLLVGFLSLLNDRRSLSPWNRELESLYKRYILAVIAVCYVDDEKLERTIAVNLQLPTLPNDGFDELLHTVDDIRDFYSCVNDPTTATSTVEVFTLDLKQT